MSIPAGISPYAGGPDPEIDLAWHKLLGNTSIRVSKSELQRNGNHRESVALRDENDDDNDGYMVWLGVYHQLHCIVSLFTRRKIRRHEILSRKSLRVIFADCKTPGYPEATATAELQRLLPSEYDQ